MGAIFISRQAEVIVRCSDSSGLVRVETSPVGEGNKEPRSHDGTWSYVEALCNGVFWRTELLKTIIRMITKHLSHLLWSSFLSVSARCCQIVESKWFLIFGQLFPLDNSFYLLKLHFIFSQIYKQVNSPKLQINMKPHLMLTMQKLLLKCDLIPWMIWIIKKKNYQNNNKLSCNYASGLWTNIFSTFTTDAIGRDTMKP